MKLIIVVVLSICLNACVNVQQYQDKGVRNLSNTELLNYRVSLITLIRRIDHDVSYNDIDTRINANLMKTYSRMGLNHAANQSGQDLVGNVVVAFFNQKSLDNYYAQLYEVGYEMKRRGWDGLGFKSTTDSEKTESSESGLYTQKSDHTSPAKANSTKVRSGRSAYEVEKIAQAANCTSNEITELVSVDKGTEFYKIKCKEREPMLFKCELNNCVKL